jgi:hypothetical protein
MPAWPVDGSRKYLEKATFLAYIVFMTDTQFSGTIVRVEPDGFGVVRFDHPVGAQANSFGIFSGTISSSSLPYPDLKPGVRVFGVAEVDQNNVASVKVLKVGSKR